MRTFVPIAALVAMLWLAQPASFAKTPSAAGGSIVIVFKDGHTQTFNLADIARIDFPAGPAAAGGDSAANPLAPSRARFFGKWEVGDGSGSNFFITLSENGDARKSMGNVHGKWIYVEGEARITWDDGWKDAIRKSGTIYQKFAYSKGKTFTGDPDNVTNAKLTTPHSI